MQASGTLEPGFFFYDPLNVLDDDDGVVDDDADGEHKRQQGDGVGRVSDEQEHGECADDGYRHGNQGNQSRSQLAEKQKDDDADENDRDDERAHHFDDRRGNEDRRVEEHRVGQIGGEARRQRVHGIANLFRHLDCVGSRRLINADCGRRRTVETAIAILRLSAHFDPGDVADADDRSVGIGAQDDGGEFLRPRQAALRLDIDLDLLLVGTGAAPTRPSAA